MVWLCNLLTLGLNKTQTVRKIIHKRKIHLQMSQWSQQREKNQLKFAAERALLKLHAYLQIIYLLVLQGLLIQYVTLTRTITNYKYSNLPLVEALLQVNSHLLMNHNAADSTLWETNATVFLPCPEIQFNMEAMCKLEYTISTRRIN